MASRGRGTAISGLVLAVGLAPWLGACSSNEMRCNELLQDFRKMRDFGDTEGRYDVMREKVWEAESLDCDMGQFIWF